MHCQARTVQHGLKISVTALTPSYVYLSFAMTSTITGRV